MARSMNRWSVDILIGEEKGRTYAEARLVTGIGDRIVGVGRAHVSAHDYDVPEIGEEVAVARALRSLGDRLLETASDDIENVTHEHVHLTH